MTEKRTSSSEPPHTTEPNKGMISRRKMLASLGVVGASFAAAGLTGGTLQACASSDKDKDKDKGNVVKVRSVDDLRAEIDSDESYVYYVQDRGLEGHFYYDESDTTSPDDGVEVIVSTSGNRFKRIFAYQSTGDETGLYEYARVKPIPPSGQIANEAETIIPYKGALYCLFKGSYSLEDQSYIVVIRPSGDGVLSVASRTDLGVGANARAMAIYNDNLFVFTNAALKVYRILDGGLQFKLDYVRKFGGWMQTCTIINGRLYAPNWESGTIDRFDLINGVPSRETRFTIGGSGNASIVTSGSFHYLIRASATDHVVRLDIDQNGDVINRGSHTIPNVALPRYATAYNGVMTIGGYGASRTVAVDISTGTPVALDDYINMPTHVRAGNYLIGRAYGGASGMFQDKTVKVRMSDGAVEVVSDQGILYPIMYKSTVFAFLSGLDGKHPNARPNDSALGQEVACYSTDALKKGIEFPECPGDYAYIDSLKYSNVKNFAPNEVIAAFKSFSPVKLGWLRVKLSYTIINNQNVPGDSVTRESVYTYFKTNSGSWSLSIPDVDLAESGALTARLDFHASGADAYVSVSEALTNAFIDMKIDYYLLNRDTGSFYLV
ncbi:hypothetical protein M6D81_08920 [Paenibacillus sp. J5C_2022]|uniref:hypothetical protein n=1 Tax=Paenibacillus sp. J5C2022 TaxID=2977129 RepID=UPI0021D2D634|nr:hypothetical protein [Paenibacillus sp. J5C2022]MCU6708841.1 hypothetical protein [Paenibacillus sp. J5C2022]